MHVLVIGAAGMIGRKLTAELIKPGALTKGAVTKFTLADVIEPAKPEGFSGAVETLASDLSAPGAAATLVAKRPDLIFHLAAIVSGEAEADFDKGYRINMDGMRFLLEAIRQEGLKSAYVPKLVFTSSIAVFGAPFPEAIGDEYFTTPLTSYGTQKAICELLLADYSRKGFVDGIGIRLPTITIRPGKPNAAASGFFSGILREPLAGQEAVLPVSRDVRHWFASPRSAVGFLVHAANLDTRKARLAADAQHAGPLGHGGRGDRGAAPRRRRCGRVPHPRGAQPDDHQDRRRLGRATSPPSAPRVWASRRTRPSTTSSAPTSRTSSAAKSPEATKPI